MPWYFEYIVHASGPVTGRIVWAKSPTMSMAKQLTFRRLEDLPPRVLEAVLDDMGRTGKATGSVPLPPLTETWPRYDPVLEGEGIVA